MANLSLTNESVPDSVVEGSNELYNRFVSGEVPVVTDAASSAPIVSTPPMPGQIPEALLPEAPSMQVPVGASNISLAPQMPAAPSQPQPVDSSQYVQPQQVAQAQEPVASPVAALEDSTKMQVGAADAISRAVAEQEFAKQEAYNTQKAAIEQREAAVLKHQDDLNKNVNARLASLDDLSKKLNSDEFANAKVDSQRFWNSKSTGERILGAIAIGLGAAGASMNGGENSALKIIQSAIDKDVEEQKFNIQQRTSNLKDRISTERNMLDELRAKFGNDMQAETAFRILANEKTQNQMDKFASKTNSVVVKAQMQSLKAKLMQEQIAQKQALKVQVELGQSLKNGDLSKIGPVELSLISKDLRELVISQRERSVDGFVGQTKDKESATKLQETSMKSAKAMDTLKRLDSFFNDGRSFSPEKRAEIATQLQLAASSLREPVLGPGTMQQAEYERLMSVLGDPNKVINIRPADRAKLKILMKNIESNLDAEAEATGLRRRPQAVRSKLYQGK